jgi:D-apionolactonase
MMNPLLYHGTAEPRPLTQFLQAGTLSARYENGSLRYIRLGDQEVLRGIYFALRDDQWNTLPTRITNENLTITDRSFHLTFVCSHVDGDTEIIRWQCELTGDKNNTIRFTIEGTVLQPFSRNRAGFCVLHPIAETIGRAVTLTHTDGSESAGVFPEQVAPHQPFVELAAMRWNLPTEAGATIQFTGDIFETEDQRNWSDTSFKTYCTPQRLPLPVQLQPGDTIQQAVTLYLTPGPSPTERGVFNVSPLNRRGAEVSTLPPSPSRPVGPLSLPFLGLCHAHDQPKLKADEAAKLRKMGLNHVRILVDFSRPDWSEWLTVGLSDAKRMQAKVVLAVFFTDQFRAELSQLQQAIEWLNPSVSAVEIFQPNHPATTSELLEAVSAPLRKLVAGARIGAGSVENFTELNRNRPALETANPSPLDYVIYALNPQVHAIDDQTLIENLAAQTDTVLTAWSFAGDMPVHVGPVTLRSRHHAGDDPRYPSLLAAGWLVGSLASLTLGGASEVTYFDTKGPKGVMEDIDPETNHGRVFPTGLVLMALGNWQGAECDPEQTYNSLTVSSLLLKKDNQTLRLLANHSWDDQTVSLPETLPESAQIWVLDETTAPASMQLGELPALLPVTGKSLILKPFAVAGILSNS